jgi:hypothetical protein
MQPHANALYVSWENPSAAVAFDHGWVQGNASEAGLTVVAAHAPSIRGYQWVHEVRRSRSGLAQVELSPDSAPLEEVVIPPMPANASRIGA